MEEKLETALLEALSDHFSLRDAEEGDIYDLMCVIKSIIPNYLRDVTEFHKTFKQPVNDDFVLDNCTDNIDLINFRIKLINEEFVELIQNSGIFVIAEATKMFTENARLLTDNYKDNIIKEENLIVNRKETLDAFCDIQYVLSGSVLALGYGDIFNEAFDAVHMSNMSKSCRTYEEVEATQKHYSNLGIMTTTEKVEVGENTRYLIKRLSDGKVLKNINYHAVNQYLTALICEKTK